MNLPRPMVPNGASSVRRSLSWKLKPAEPVRYQRSSNSCAEAAWAKARPPSSAAVRIFLFIEYSSYIGGMKPVEAWASTTTADSARHRREHYAQASEGDVNSPVTCEYGCRASPVTGGCTLYRIMKNRNGQAQQGFCRASGWFSAHFVARESQ